MLLTPSPHLHLFSFILAFHLAFLPSCFHTSFSLTISGILLPSLPSAPPSNNTGLHSGTSPSLTPLPPGAESPYPASSVFGGATSISMLSPRFCCCCCCSPRRAWLASGQLLLQPCLLHTSAGATWEGSGDQDQEESGSVFVFSFCMRPEAMGIAKDH